MRSKIVIFLAAVLCVGTALGAGSIWPVDRTKTAGDSTGVDTTNAFPTVLFAVEADSAAPGDTIMLRPTHFDTLDAVMTFPSSGTLADPIVIWVDDGHIWPNDDPDSVYISCQADYWYLYNEDYWIIGTAGTGSYLWFRDIQNRGVYLRSCAGVEFHHCLFSNSLATSDYPIYTSAARQTWFHDCAFDGNDLGAPGNNYGRLIIGTSSMVFTDCTFDGMYKVFAPTGGSDIVLEECIFDDDETSTEYLDASDGAVYLLNCTMPALATHINPPLDLSTLSKKPLWYDVYLGDKKRPDVYAEHDAYIFHSDYDSTRSGSNSDYALKLDSDQDIVSAEWPLEILAYSVPEDSSAVRAFGTYVKRNASGPAGAFRLDVKYNSGDTLLVDQTISNMVAADGTWYELTSGSLTQNHDGPVYVTLYLIDDAAGSLYHIDPELSVTGEEHKGFFPSGVNDLSNVYIAPSDEDPGLTPGRWLKNQFYFNNDGAKQWEGLD